MVWLSSLTTTIFLEPCNIVSLITTTFKNNFLKSAVSYHVVIRERWCVYHTLEEDSRQAM